LCRHLGDSSISHVHGNVSTPYSSRYGGKEAIPKYSLPKDGIPSNAAYQLIHDELDFDGKPNLNVASFVTTYMEPEAVSTFETQSVLRDRIS
jgi:glutamate decarboxylase